MHIIQDRSSAYLLLQAGADVHVKDQKQKTPCDYHKTLVTIKEEVARRQTRKEQNFGLQPLTKSGRNARTKEWVDHTSFYTDANTEDDKVERTKKVVDHGIDCTEANIEDDQVKRTDIYQPDEKPEGKISVNSVRQAITSHRRNTI